MLKLKDKVKYGIRYVTFLSLFNKLITFLVTIVLARILLPADFGMITLASLIIGAIGLFKNFGLVEFLIQTKKTNKKVYNTAFWFALLLAIFLIIICFFIAKPVAIFYKKSALEQLIKFLSIIFLIESLGFIPSTMLERDLKFSKKLIPETVPLVLYALFSIYFAKHGLGFWSIAIAQVISSVTQNLLFYIVNPWKPGFDFDFKILKKLLNFGQHMLLLSVFLFLLLQGDSALIGKVLGIQALGFYALAYSLTSFPITSLVNVINRVTLPTYSKIKKNKEILKVVYLKVLTYTLLLILPLYLGLILLSKEITLALYGEKWLLSVGAMIVLSFFGLFRTISSSSGNLFIAIGKPEILKKITFIQMIILAIVIYPLTKVYGIVGTGISVSFANLIAMFFILFTISKILNISIYIFINTIKVPLFASLFMIFCLYLLKEFILIKFSLVNTLILILLGIIIYFSVILLFDRKLLKVIMEEIK